MHQQNVSIPEESGFISGVRDDVEYILDLGSGAAESACPTPPISHIRRPIPFRPFRPTRTVSTSRKEADRDCGICFELAVAPVRTLCCVHLFCAEHIAAWLDGPASDGLCPSCRAPSASMGLRALGHPALMHLVPRTPPPSRSPTPSNSECSTDSSSSVASYASYPSTPAAPSLSDTDASSEEEDATDYSLPALVRARALQTRRHTPHPFSSVVGVRAAVLRAARIAGWLVIVAVLAARGRWAVNAD
ncbi:hypothetical protein C8F04DRAFT_67712 [Mycena alexandri]|uniref:RING-type domain-containing protein n=1 Tax=Mycena alexandri TaxID=1745969 RepID=A0AAD6X137_9AGAR|nr:hypothetical protein C8F04DRAFT_67712 [Mycena alexandri]